MTGVQTCALPIWKQRKGQKRREKRQEKKELESRAQSEVGEEEPRKEEEWVEASDSDEEDL